MPNRAAVLQYRHALNSFSVTSGSRGTDTAESAVPLVGLDMTHTGVRSKDDTRIVKWRPPLDVGQKSLETVHHRPCTWILRLPKTGAIGPPGAPACILSCAYGQLLKATTVSLPSPRSVSVGGLAYHGALLATTSTNKNLP